MHKFIKAILISLLATYSCVVFAAGQCTTNNMLIISDIHLDSNASNTMAISPPGYNPDNDLDTATFKQLMAQIASSISNTTITKPCTVVVLGDIVGHARMQPNSVATSETAVFKSLAHTFPNTPIFYAPGNNDSFKRNYGPFTDTSSSNTVKSAYDVATVNAGWKNGFLSTGVKCSSKHQYPCMINENKTFGYYDAYLENNLRIIALNTVLFSPYRSGVTQQDAIDELNWLEGELSTASTNNERVIIAMHIPPGNTLYDGTDDWLTKEEGIFLSKIKTYHPIILGMLASHTHMDEIKVIEDNQQNIISGIYYTAGLSTSHGNAPSAKTFYLNQQNNQWGITNYQSYYFHRVNTALTLDKLYDYQTQYCNGTAVANLTTCLANVDSTKIKHYFSAGNSHFGGTMGSPNEYIIEVL